MAVVIFILMSNTGDREIATVAANARVPLGDIFKGLEQIAGHDAVMG